MCCLISHPHTGLLLIEAPQSNSKEILNVWKPEDILYSFIHSWDECGDEL